MIETPHAHGPDCGCRSDPLGLALSSIGAHVAILKAKGLGDLLELAKAEIRFRDDLVDAHARAWDSALKTALGSLGTSGEATARDVDRFASTLSKTYSNAFGPAAAKLFAVFFPKVYKLGKSAAWKKALGQFKGSLQYPSPEPVAETPVKKATLSDLSAGVAATDAELSGKPIVPEGYEPAGAPKPKRASPRHRVTVDPSFNVKDEQAIRALTDSHRFWVGDFVKAASPSIKGYASTTLLDEGLSKAEAGANLRTKLDGYFSGLGSSVDAAIPAGYTGTPKLYFEGVAANAATVGRVYGSVRGFADLGVSEFTIVNPGDESTCERCLAMDGKTFPVQTGIDQVSATIAGVSAGGDPKAEQSAVRSAQPWISESQFAKLPKDSAGLAAAGVCLPPYHLACRCTVDVAPGATLGAPEAPVVDLPPWERPFGFDESQLTKVEKRLPGAHEKYVFADPSGAEWLFKPAATESEAFLAHAEKAANDLALSLDVPAAETHVVTIKGRTGSIQRMLEGVEGDFEKMNLVDVTDAQVDETMRQSALNFLLGDNDAHAGNFLRLKDGTIAGIDHGQVFKFYERDSLLDLSYKPNGGAHDGSLIQLLLRDYEAGKFGPRKLPLSVDDLPKLKKVLEDLERMTDEKILSFARAYRDGAAAERLGVFSSRVGWSVADFDAAILKRRAGLRAEFEKLFKQAVEARDKALAPKVKAKVAKDVVTPIDHKFMLRVGKAKARGVSVFVGGSDFEDMHLVTHGTRNDGLWLEGKLRAGGDSKIAKYVGDLSKTLSTSPGLSSPASTSLDPIGEDVLKVFKSYNAHLDPTHSAHSGDVPQKTKDLANATVKKLLSNLSTSDVGSPESAKSIHYLKEFEKIGKTSSAGVDLYEATPKLAKDGIKFEPYHGVVPKAPVTVAPSQAPAGVPSKYPVKVIKWGDVSKSFVNGEIVVDESTFLEWDQAGEAYEIDLGEGAKVLYRPHGPGKQEFAEHGAIKVWINKPAADVKPDEIERAFAKLEEIGLSTKKASPTDLDVLYLRKVANVSGLGSDPRFAIPEDLPVKEQLEKLKAAFEEIHPGFEKTRAWKKRLVWDEEEGDGRPRWMRFDIASELDKAAKAGWGLIHNLGGGRSAAAKAQRLDAILSSTRGLASTEERLRMGIQTPRTIEDLGMSASSDRHTGGSVWAYTRVRSPKDLLQSPEFNSLKFDFRVAGDADAASYDHDAFGKTYNGYREANGKNGTVKGIKACAGNNSNETLFKSRLGLEWLEEIPVEDETSRQAFLDVFQKHGIRQLHGKDVEEIVKVKRFDSSIGGWK